MVKDIDPIISQSSKIISHLLNLYPQETLDLEISIINKSKIEIIKTRTSGTKTYYSINIDASKEFSVLDEEVRLNIEKHLMKKARYVLTLFDNCILEDLTIRISY